MRKFIVLSIILILSSMLIVGCSTETQARLKKDNESAREGLNRLLTVYSHDGKVLKTVKGKFDVEPSTENNKVKFDINGQRFIIYNAVIVCEEVKD